MCVWLWLSLPPPGLQPREENTDPRESDGYICCSINMEEGENTKTGRANEQKGALEEMEIPDLFRFLAPSVSVSFSICSCVAIEVLPSISIDISTSG